MLRGGMIFRTAKALIISINNESIPVSKLAMTGKEIKMLVNGPLDYLLTRVSEEGDDKSISDDELVMLKDGMRFRIVTSCHIWLIPLALPPLLQKHIEVLKSKGHVIETKCEDNQICIIFKNYKILSDIWDRSQVDLTCHCASDIPKC